MNEPRGHDAAALLLQIGRPAEAIEAIGSEADQDDPFTWYLLGRAHLELERPERALHAFQTGLSIDPEDVWLLDACTAAHMELGDLASAEARALDALRLVSDDAHLLTRYAVVVARAGQIEKSERLVARALEIDAQSSYALRVHALLARARGDEKLAIHRSTDLLRTFPEDVLGRTILAEAHDAEGDHSTAAEHYTAAVVNDPSAGYVAEAARNHRARMHWLLLPLRPIERIGPIKVWLAFIVAFLAIGAAGFHQLQMLLAIVWVVICVYSWVVPPLVLWRGRRRFGRL